VFHRISSVFYLSNNIHTRFP